MKDGKLHHRTHNLTGQTFGKLTVLGPSHSDGRKWHWKARCQCGTVVVKIGTEMKKQVNRGQTPNCGCLTKQLQRANRTTHGLSTHPAYAVWSSMVQRCYTPAHKAYKNYGGRGITVCSQWRTFEGFWNDMGDAYESGLTLDRIDNNAGYCKSNCRWVSRRVQASNRRNSLPFCIRTAEAITGAKRTTLYYRWHHKLSMTSSTPDPDRDSWSKAMRDRS